MDKNTPDTPEIDYSKYDSIPTSTIYKDIEDTKKEIAIRRLQIKQREEFIAKTRAILAYRQELSQ